MLRLAIEGIIRTFRSDPAASEVLLRLPLEPDRMKAVGFVEIPVLAHEISSLIDLSPALARDIYVAAFDFDEVSEEETVMRGGVVSLTSTKKQDYRAAYFALKEGFSKLMREAPDEAIDALSAIQRARYNELR
jgi:hypothetical protein